VDSFHDFEKLHHLKIALEMILDEPFASKIDRAISNLDRHTPSHIGKSPGIFSSLLPPSLQSLKVLAFTHRHDRVHTYWLALIKDILQNQPRRSALKSITIEQDRAFEDCESCTFSGRCSLCAKSKISDTMKRLCEDAGITLLMFVKIETIQH
jgi:hypothetical protein